MNQAQTIDIFQKLGVRFSQALNPSDWANDLFERAKAANPWFVEPFVRLQFEQISQWLTTENIQAWLSAYPLLPLNNPSNIGLVLAGNLPLVGLHDILCVIASGHIAQVKPSSNDRVLMQWVREQLIEIDPSLAQKMVWVERLQKPDALIATGSDSTKTHLDYYFGKVPRLLRANRVSIAILNGSETDEQLYELGKDVFRYFGLGCRSVSHICIPEGFDADRLRIIWEPEWTWIYSINRYANNLDYQKAVYLLNQKPFWDMGCFLMKEDDSPFSPGAVLNYSWYKSKDELEAWVYSQKPKLQCIVGNVPGLTTVYYGKSQEPNLNDYADGVDTLSFLQALKPDLN